ncbi:hypothetical protein [Nostoc sp.]|uniref:hypothetical protein n=1 Tax=Nostoc sp. TaxID=1180 RepID=UPI002FF99AA4
MIKSKCLLNSAIAWVWGKLMAHQSAPLFIYYTDNSRNSASFILCASSPLVSVTSKPSLTAA